MLLAIILLLQGTTPPVDPLAEAWKGRIQCHNPDVARKTCQSIGNYFKRPDGVIENTAVALLNAQPAIVMTSVAPVEIKDGAVCGKISSPEEGIFTIDGITPPVEVVSRLRAAVATATASIAEREICTSYVRDGEALKAVVRVAGAPRPEFDMRVLWVTPSDGFSVRP